MPRSPAGLVVLSGGQTGVDRIALDVAAELGLARGGWCPRGRRAEDGAIPAHYPLWEHARSDYPARTRANVAQADGTLILCRDLARSRGTRLTLEHARELGRPVLVLGPEADAREATEWITGQGLALLNVAGPRASGDPGLDAWVPALMRRALAPFAPPAARGRTALWAMPEREARAALQGCIDDLARAAGGRTFVPHVTLAVGEALALPPAPPPLEVAGIAHDAGDPRRVLTLELSAPAAWPWDARPHVSLSYAAVDLARAEACLRALGPRLAFDVVWAVDVGGPRRGGAPRPEEWWLRGARP